MKIVGVMALFIIFSTLTQERYVCVVVKVTVWKLLKTSQLSLNPALGRTNIKEGHSADMPFSVCGAPKGLFPFTTDMMINVLVCCIQILNQTIHTLSNRRHYCDLSLPSLHMLPVWIIKPSHQHTHIYIYIYPLR